MYTYRLDMRVYSKSNLNIRQNMEEIWSSATIEIKTDLVMAECLMRRLNYSKHQAYQQLSNNKRKLDKLVDQYEHQELEKVWHSFFQTQRRQIQVALAVKKFILVGPAKTYSTVLSQTISWFQQKPLPSILIEELRLYHLQEILNNWVNWKKAKQQLQGPLESLKLVFVHYQHPFPENFFHSFAYNPANPVFEISNFPHIRLLHEAALLWQQITHQTMFEGLWENGRLSTRHLEQNYLVVLFEDWRGQRLLDQLFSQKTLDNNTQAIYFNGLAFKHAEGKHFIDLIYNTQLEKNSLYKALNTHERIKLLEKKFDQLGESTQYRIGSLSHSLASILKRIHYYQHSELSSHFRDIKTLFLKFKQMEEQWQHEKNYPIHPRILLALHLAESNNDIISANDENNWQTKVKELLHYLTDKIKRDREAKLILEDHTTETKDQSTWLDKLETWTMTIPIVGPLLTVEEGIRHKNPREIISGTLFLGLDASSLLYKEAEAIEEIAFSVPKLLKNLLFRERIVVDDTHFTFKALKVNADDLFLEGSTLLHSYSPLELEKNIAIPADIHGLAQRVRLGGQELKWREYDLVYLHNEDRVVPVKPQGGSFREVDWQSGEVDTSKHLIFKDKASGNYFSTAGLRGGGLELELSKADLPQRVTVQAVKFLFYSALDFTSRDFKSLFKLCFVIENHDVISITDALEFYNGLYQNSPSFRRLFNQFEDYFERGDEKRWTISIYKNAKICANFDTNTIHIGADTEIRRGYYMSPQGIESFQPERAYLHELLHALTGTKDPKKWLDINNRGPIVYLTDKILNEAGYTFPQRLRYRRVSLSSNQASFADPVWEKHKKQMHSVVAQENSYLDGVLSKGTPAGLQKVFGSALTDRNTIKDLMSIFNSLQPMSIYVSDFALMYDNSFSECSKGICNELRNFYEKLHEESTTFRGLFNLWWSARVKKKDHSCWHFVVDDIPGSLTELPLHKNASCINMLTQRIHIFDDKTYYLSDKGLMPVEKVRRFVHKMVQLLTNLKDIPKDLTLTNRGAVVHFTDKILKEANIDLPKQLVNRLVLEGDIETQKLLEVNWLDAQRAMQLEDKFIEKEIPELMAISCSSQPQCKQQVHTRLKRGTLAQPVKPINTELLEDNRKNIRTLWKKNDTFDQVWEQGEAYLTQYNQQQAKHSAIRQTKSKHITTNPIKLQQKQNHYKFKSIPDNKHRAQQNKAALHLFKSATKKPLLSKARDLLHKQPKHYNMLPTSRIHQAINIPTLFQRNETKPSERQLLTTALTPKLISEKNTGSHRQTTSPGISQLNAISNLNSTLFFMDTLMRTWLRNSHRPIPSSTRLDKQAEKQIQMILERKAFNKSGSR